MNPQPLGKCWWVQAWHTAGKPGRYNQGSYSFFIVTPYALVQAQPRDG